ncbi:MAG: peptidylprolyl isomerase [Proteobacteria bacterium]|nr:peptidylprolyl isomerase [Pseudomonadota bacterium]
MISTKAGRAALGALAAAAFGAAVTACGAAWAAPLSQPPAAQQAPAPGGNGAAAGKGAAPAGPRTDIVAVVNGDVISNDDVIRRTRLFGMSTGIPMTPEVLERLKPQITRQLIDERLRLQEIQRRKIVVSDQQIADAIHQIEQGNGMPPGTLRQRLSADGAGFRTLVDQVRVQIGWSDVLRQTLGERAQLTPQDIEAQKAILAQQTGKPEYHIGEIFIPVDDPQNTADAQRFTETVISQLRAGAPFPVVAAQFSQSQSALSGGDEGWRQANQLDPGVAQLVLEMPVGAISNPVKVPGGFSIVQLRGKRELGNENATVLSLRQLFLPFASPLNPQAPTEQQRQMLDKAKAYGSSLRSCDDVEAAAKAQNQSRPIDPGEIRLEQVSPPQFRQLLAGLPIGKASQPLVANDGIMVVMVCSREEKNVSQLSDQEIRQEVIGERAELASRQLLRELRRKANIDLRGAA